MTRDLTVRTGLALAIGACVVWTEAAFSVNRAERSGACGTEQDRSQD